MTCAMPIQLLGALESSSLICFMHRDILRLFYSFRLGLRVMYRNDLFHREIHQERQNWQYGAAVLDSAYGAARDNRYPYPLDQM
jgi:hypothetical protein